MQCRLYYSTWNLPCIKCRQAWIRQLARVAEKATESIVRLGFLFLETGPL